MGFALREELMNVGNPRHVNITCHLCGMMILESDPPFLDHCIDFYYLLYVFLQLTFVHSSGIESYVVCSSLACAIQRRLDDAEASADIDSKQPRPTLENQSRLSRPVSSRSGL